MPRLAWECARPSDLPALTSGGEQFLRVVVGQLQSRFVAGSAGAYKLAFATLLIAGRIGVHLHGILVATSRFSSCVASCCACWPSAAYRSSWLSHFRGAGASPMRRWRWRCWQAYSRGTWSTPSCFIPRTELGWPSYWPRLRSLSSQGSGPSTSSVGAGLCLLLPQHWLSPLPDGPKSDLNC